MSEIFLIRHGLTDSNKKSIFQGISDNNLNSIGFNQAKKVSDFLKTKNIEDIYSSPMIRAINTSKPLSKEIGVNIIVEKTLREIDCGDWEGKSIFEIKENSNQFDRWIYEGNFKAPNGESIEDLMIKLKPFLSKLLKQSLKTDKNIAVFAHGAVNRAIICSFLGLSSKYAFRFQQNNGCINIFKVSKNLPLTVNLLNFTQHLKESKND